MTPDIAKHIDSHVRKAERLHPKFCHGLVCEGISIETWERWEAFDKRICDRNPNAYNIMHEELMELFHAIARRDWIHARSELYDAIAVLIRLDGEIVRRIEGGEK